MSETRIIGASKKNINKAEAEKKLRAEYERKSQMVKGLFTFNEQRGATFKFGFCEFPKRFGDCPTMYELKDGEMCTIPLGVAEHIRDNLFYYEVEERMECGQAMRIKRKVRRATFENSDFTPVSLVEAEPVNAAKIHVS